MTLCRVLETEFMAAITLLIIDTCKILNIIYERATFNMKGENLALYHNYFSH